MAKKYHIPKDDLERLLIEEGKLIQDVADIYGCSRRTVQKRMNEYGILLRPRVEIDDEELKRLHASGMGIIELAEHFNCHNTTISDRCIELGISRPFWQQAKEHKGEDHWAWEGGVDVTDAGYIRVRIDGVHKAQHRWIMEDIIGRELDTDEIVHHKDGNPANNVPSNLLLVYGIAEHMRLHAAMRRDPDLDQEAWLEEYRAKQRRSAA